MRRLILANLDCELHYARSACPGPIKELPARVRKAVARASLALEVFGSPGDHLWTLVEMPASCSPLQLHSGPMQQLGDFEQILAWGQVTGMPQPTSQGEGGPRWQDALFASAPTPLAAATCNDRRFAETVRRHEEWSLPEVETVHNLSELDHYLSSATLGPREAWIAKAPFSASGRQRLKRHGRVLEGEQRVRAERLLMAYGALVMEPWMARTADYGCAGVVGATRHHILPPHQLLSDESGVFRGIRIADRETESALGPIFHQAIRQSAQGTAEALSEAGYRGPFGIDSFVYKDAGGGMRLQSLCEINARMCFGLVARAHAERQGESAFDFRPALAQ